MTMPDLDRIRAHLPAHYEHCERDPMRPDVFPCTCTGPADIAALLDIADQVDPNRDLP